MSSNYEEYDTVSEPGNSEDVFLEKAMNDKKSMSSIEPLSFWSLVLCGDNS